MTDAAQAIWGAVPGLLAGLLGLGLPHYVVGAVSGVLVLLAAFRGVRLRKARDAAIRGAELAEWRCCRTLAVKDSHDESMRFAGC